jgi:type I restriction enzyme S subunit
LDKTATSPQGIPVVTARQLLGGKIILTNAARIDPRTADRLSPEGRLLPSDVVLARRSDPLRHGLAGPEHAGAVLDSSCIRVRPRTDLFGDQVTGEYLNHYLTHPGVQQWLDSHLKRGIIPNHQVIRLRDLPVLVPPPAEQHRIVDLLACLNDKIQAHEQLRTVTRLLKARLIEPLLS